MPMFKRKSKPKSASNASNASKKSETFGPNPNMPKYGKAVKKKMKEMMK